MLHLYTAVHWKFIFWLDTTDKNDTSFEICNYAEVKIMKGMQNLIMNFA